MVNKIKKAILIDSENREVREIEYRTFEELKQIMGVQWVQSIGDLPKKHTCYVDEEGLLHNPQHFFISDFYPQPVAGNGAIIGTNNHGDDISCKLTLDYIKARVHFITLEQVIAGIRMGLVDFNTYYSPFKEGTLEPDLSKRELISTIDLGAFNND